MAQAAIGMPIDIAIGMPIIGPMRTSDAVDFFKTQQGVADALGIKQSSVAEWGEYPPPLRQVQLEAVTDRKLLAEPDVLTVRAKAAA